MAHKGKDKRHIVTKTIRVGRVCVPKTKKRDAHCIKAHTRKIKDIAGQKMGFDKLAKEVAKGYEGKKVPRKYQSEYGKRYSHDEALDVGRKVAGKQRAGFFKKKGISMKADKGGVLDNMDWIITGKNKI